MAFSIFRQPVIKRLENNIGTIKMKKYFIVLWEKSGFFVGFICGFQKGIECRPSGKENCLENRGVFLISVYHRLPGEIYKSSQRSSSSRMLAKSPSKFA